MNSELQDYVDNFSKGDLGLIRRAILLAMREPTMSYYDFDRYADLYNKVKQLQHEITHEREEQ